MGFTPGLRTESLGVGPEYSFLASAHYTLFRAGITLDAALVGADADLDKILLAGTVIGKVTSGGKYGAYDNTESDGREVAVGFLMETVNLKDGDVIAAAIHHGSVIVPRTSGLDASGRVDLAGHFFFVE